MRLKTITNEEASRMSKLCVHPENIRPVPDFKSIKKMLLNFNKAKGEVEDAVRNADIVVARLPSGTGSLAVKYARKFRKPYLAEITACNWDSFWNYNWKGRLIAPYYWLKQRRITKYLPFAIYVTKDFLQRRYPCRGETIHCSNVELKTLDESVLQRRLTKIDSAPIDQKDKIIIGTVGAVNVNYKNQAMVIRALPLLQKAGYTCEYRLLGQGDPSALSHIAEKCGVRGQVKFLGSRSHERVFSEIDEFDIYAHPSNQEGLPRALIEALSRACPALGSNVAGIPELLPKDRVFRKNNLNDLVNILTSMFETDLKEEARRNFETSKSYTLEVLNRRRYKFFATFLNHHGIDVPRELERQAN
jgi:glycosyltransferase involved in cell wall biosynthesis